MPQQRLVRLARTGTVALIAFTALGCAPNVADSEAEPEATMHRRTDSGIRSGAQGSARNGGLPLDTDDELDTPDALGGADSTTDPDLDAGNSLEASRDASVPSPRDAAANVDGASGRTDPPATHDPQDPVTPQEPPSSSCTPDRTTHRGEGTFYDGDGTGNCSFDKSPDRMSGAMNETDYARAAICGACVRIKGPNGEITVRIDNRCPECKPGDIDLLPEAFSKIANRSAGRVSISWHLVDCDVKGSVRYRFKDGSSQWWTAVQVRNHKTKIAKFEYKTKSGSFKSVTREMYNYFVEPGGMGPGPYTFRVTDIYGRVIEDNGVPLVPDGETAGHGQFAPCDS